MRHRIAAGLLVRADTVLLCHRSVDRKWFPDVWDLPGGHIEAEETPFAALARELLEELTVTVLETPGAHSFSRATEEFEMFVWIIRRWSGSATNSAPDEHDEIGWFTQEEVSSLRLADPAYLDWIGQALASST